MSLIAIIFTISKYSILVPFNEDLIFRNKKKLLVAMFGEYSSCSIIAILCIARNVLTDRAMYFGTLSSGEFMSHSSTFQVIFSPIHKALLTPLLIIAYTFPVFFKTFEPLKNLIMLLTLTSITFL